MSEVAMTGNADIDGILWGYKWDQSELTFSFPTGTSNYGYAEINGFQAFNGDQKAVMRKVLDSVASFTGLSFAETSGQGQLTFAEADSIRYYENSQLKEITTARGTPPDPERYPDFAQGDMWFNHDNYNDPEPGSYAFRGFMHELGHALGLKHGHAEQVGHGETFPELPADHDSFEYSVMTYSQYVGDTEDENGARDQPQSYMQNDIAALQHLYGANYGFNDGNTTYGFSPTTGEFFVNGVSEALPDDNFILRTIWDGGGTDTYDFGNYGTDLDVDLAPGAWTTVSEAQLADLGSVETGPDAHEARGSIANALLHQGNLASLIENATGGAGDDVIRGNQATNTLLGGAGEDYLDGRGALDVLRGGMGNDIYHLDDVSMFFRDEVFDLVQEYAGGGIDTVSVARASINGTTVDSYALGGHIENGVVMGSGAFDLYGNGAANYLAGNTGTNVLRGDFGADTLTGGQGVDALRGGLGNDVYKLNDANFYMGGAHYDIATEQANQGTDTVEVRRAVSGSTAVTHYALAANIENGVVKAYSAFDLSGNALDNALTGNKAANRLDGAAGADTMTGGLGDDVYVIDDAGDVVIELAGGGSDRLASAGNLALASNGNIENLQLLGIGDFVGSGNGAGNWLSGNTGNNVLVGYGGNDLIFADDHEDILNGGIGADTLNGGHGGDTMQGGADADHFYFASLLDSSGTNAALRDRINDFEGGDRIDVSTIDADQSLSGFQDFSLDLGAGFLAGEIRQTVQGPHLLIEFNTDADAQAEMAIQLITQATPLTAGDFIL